MKISPIFVSARTLQANTRRQTSDRFVKAIERLETTTSLDIRLGGIYGLEQPPADGISSLASRRIPSMFRSASAVMDMNGLQPR